MPLQSRSEYNEYMRSYMKRRWDARRARAVEQLGGVCATPGCGKTDDLHFDHRDPWTKVMSIARMSSASEERLQEELSKCQLLCTECHKNKTRTNGDCRIGREREIARAQS